MGVVSLVLPTIYQFNFFLGNLILAWNKTLSQILLALKLVKAKSCVFSAMWSSLIQKIKKNIFGKLKGEENLKIGFYVLKIILSHF